jgi:hypothetical protein
MLCSAPRVGASEQLLSLDHFREHPALESAGWGLWRTFGPRHYAPPKPGDNDRDASGTIPLRAPDLPPSLAPAELAVGFGPKGAKPYASQGSLAGDSPRGPTRSLVGPPPPGATRGLGVLLASYCHPAVYASQRPLSMIIFDGGAWRLFTQVRGIGILGSSHLA